MQRWQLSAQEIARYGVIESTIEGYLKADLAAEELCLSKRQVFRLKRKLKEKGIEGIIHGNRGRASPRRIPDPVRDTIDYLYREKYDGFNISHFTEMLAEREGIFISRETIRGILLQKGSYKKKKKYPKHRSWREPMPKEGMMLQFDTSDHDWLQARGPRIKLIGGIDDATKDVPWALFAYQDSVEENMAVCKKIIKRKGIPLSLYVDKDSKFITTRHGGLHVNIKKEQGKTQMQRAWEELGINVIYAESPQAKGRIERLWGTFQDRLISELRLEAISSLEGANGYLHTVFLPKHNKKFTRKPKVEDSAYRMIPKGMDLNRILCIKKGRRVQGDNTISYEARRYQILPTETRLGFAKAKVEVQKHLDKTIHIFYKGQELPSKPIMPVEDEQLYVPSQKEALLVGV
jgi:transposase